MGQLRLRRPRQQGTKDRQQPNKELGGWGGQEPPTCRRVRSPQAECSLCIPELSPSAGRVSLQTGPSSSSPTWQVWPWTRRPGTGVSGGGDTGLLTPGTQGQASWQRNVADGEIWTCFHSPPGSNSFTDTTVVGGRCGRDTNFVPCLPCAWPRPPPRTHQPAWTPASPTLVLSLPSAPLHLQPPLPGLSAACGRSPGCRPGGKGNTPLGDGGSGVSKAWFSAVLNFLTTKTLGVSYCCRENGNMIYAQIMDPIS